jgi:F-box and WD-40 domain protein 1/11
MTSSVTPPLPPTFNAQELTNAAAGVVSDRKSVPRPLRTSQSFRLDEGYSGEETPIMYDDGSGGQDPRSMDFKVPPWMAGLNDALREG